MRAKAVSVLVIFILSIVAINCDRNANPFVSEINTGELEGNAVLVGNVVLKGSNHDIGFINIGVRGTNLRANPDEKGHFRIDNLPLGDILLDINVKGTLSYIPINNVTSNDEISVEIEVLSNDKAGFSDIKKNNKPKKELSVTIQPDEWDTSWVNSSGDVTAKISGKGFDDIVVDSVLMVGPDGAAIASSTFGIGKKFFEAKFLRSEAIGLITDPVVGQSYEIKVTGSLSDGTTFELTDMIVIEEEDDDEEEEGLELEIKPDEWNISWVSSTGNVTAKISGEGFDSIDPALVQMIGPDGAAINPYSTTVGDKFFGATFLRSAAIGIITDPEPGQSYEIMVTGSLSDSTTFELTDTITIEELELELEIKPEEWDTSWVSSTGNVTAKISGEGFDSIDAASVQMIGPDGAAISSDSTTVGDKSFEAKFLRSAAIGLITNPVAGQSYEIMVTGSLGGGTTFELTDIIIIEEEDDDDEEGEGELELEIDPKNWNTNWKYSEGLVTVRIKGEAFENIAPDSVQMIGPEGDVITPDSSIVTGNSFMAKFVKKDAIGIITDPEPGQSYEIQVTGEVSTGTSFTLTDTITIVGKEIEEVELSLEIIPNRWNANWAEKNGEVRAKISGDGFENIESDTVLMIGPDGGTIEPFSSEITKRYFQAGFTKKEAIELIIDPVPGNNYEIQVIGELSDGSDFNLKYTIRITGSRK
ncbi:MAG: hypothetical protein JSV96_03520 [Candidatus Aminicenantes bacterium]|nr:MAG: hypothetical protein JSV96_03520 [Candidatus Aminicenantes bacterium]